MKLSPLALAITLLPALPAVHAASRDQALQLPGTVITANREAQPRDDVSSSVTVFTREDIERLRPASVLELLTHAPGVQVANYGGRGGLYGLYIRGTSTAQSLVLIDGVRVGSATAGGASLQYLSVDQIERVEVLRGSRSALYGADALGGVVQIFTRRGQGFGLHPSLRIAGGSDGTWEHSAGLSGGNERTRFSLSAAQEETQGFDRTRTSYASDADHDGYRNRSIAASLSHQLSDTLEVGVSVLDQRGRTETDNPFGRYDAATWSSHPSEPYDDFLVSSSSAYLDARLSDAWTSRLELGHSEDKQENFDKLFPGSTTYNTYRDSLNWLNSIALNTTHTLRVGAEYLNDKVRSSSDYVEPSRKNHALFAQHSYQGEHFSTELGVRHDKNEQYGSENTFNAALTLPVTDRDQLVLSYAEGFRVPTFADLYWPLDVASWYVGNPDLKPERSRSVELKWRGQWLNSPFEIAAYRSEIKDLLASAEDARTGLGTTENIDRARINGLELSVQRELFGWQADAGLSLLDARDRRTGLRLPNRARRTLYLDLDRQFGAFGIGASWRAVSRTQSYSWDKRETYEIAGHGVLDLRASWQASAELLFDAKWSNVLDKDYSRLLYSYQGRQYGYQEAPSGFLIGLTWTPQL